MELQSDILEVAKWVQDNSLTFNTSKCKSMLIIRKMKTMPPLYLNGQVIVEVKNYKYLGVHLTSDLKWDTHITTICQKSKKTAWCHVQKVLHYCRSYLSLQALPLSSPSNIGVRMSGVGSIHSEKYKRTRVGTKICLEGQLPLLEY